MCTTDGKEKTRTRLLSDVLHPENIGHGPRNGDLVPSKAAGQVDQLTVPIARTFPLEDWREALAVSLSGHAHGKLVLLSDRAAGRQ